MTPLNAFWSLFYCRYLHFCEQKCFSLAYDIVIFLKPVDAISNSNHIAILLVYIGTVVSTKLQSTF